MPPLRVVHYLNQFYAGEGGEDAADHPLTVLPKPIGPGVKLREILGNEAEVVATLVCGDNHAATDHDAFAAEVRQQLRGLAPDLVVAGPAFNAGRYGLACGEVCLQAAELGIPAVTAMHPENPGVPVYRQHIFILPVGASAITMASDLARLATLGLRLVRKEPIGSPAEGGYLPHGFRHSRLTQLTAAERALDMLAARLQGLPFTTEIPLPEVERVDPAPPIQDLARATLALISTGAIVPQGNPGRLKQSNSTEWQKYDIGGLDRLEPGEWEPIHGGYDGSAARTNPNLVVPLDALRLLEGKIFAQLHPYYYVTAGVGTSVIEARRMAREIAAELHRARIGGVVLTAT